MSTSTNPQLITFLFFPRPYIGFSSSPQSPVTVAARPNNNRGKCNGLVPECSILDSPFPRSYRQLPHARNSGFARLQARQVRAAAPHEHPVSSRTVPLRRHRSGLGADGLGPRRDFEIRSNDEKGLGNGSVRLREKRGVGDETEGEKPMEAVQLVYNELSGAHGTAELVRARESTVAVSPVLWDAAVAEVI